MLCKRWRWDLRNRSSGIDFKSPYGAVVKSYGIERLRKRQAIRVCQIGVLEMDESEPAMTFRSDQEMVDSLAGENPAALRLKLSHA